MLLLVLLVPHMLSLYKAESHVTSEPHTKQPRMSLFAHYTAGKSETLSDSVPVRAEKQLTSYLNIINSPLFNADELTLTHIYNKTEYSLLRPLFQRLLCVPASSASVERVLSDSGLFLRPPRARMSDSLLESLVFMKCNI